jgi:hypothetical protein
LSPGDAADPRAACAERLAARRAEAAARARVDRALSNARLAVFAAGVIVAFLIFGSRLLAPVWLALPVLAFLALAVAHDRAIRARERAERAAAFYEAMQARIEGRTPPGAPSGERFRDAEHPYAEDLDLFGEGSLYARLCTARTRAGEDTLAAWLLTPAEPETVRARQAAVAELRPALDLREDLAVLGAGVGGSLHAERLRAWGEAPRVLSGRALPALALLLAGLAVAALAGWTLGALGPAPFALALAAEAAFALPLRARVTRAVRDLELPAHELALLADLLERLEAERFQAPLLVGLREALDTRGVPPSRRLRQLRRLVDLLEARRNQLFAPLAALLLWTTQLAFAVERWRDACGPALGRWIAALGEIEALSALAGFAHERPELTFPELTAGGPRFEAEDLGHVLLPAERCVRNDLRLGDETRLLIVSGSNMSGKSTLLRAVGTNAVLAEAGAPVCARRLRLSPLAVGASLRVRDSLQEGTSRFYAEIRRLGQIVGLAEGPRPVLFLLDEILHGTNSHDRGIGAEALLRGLLARGAVGLVTTHDLALARLADTLPGAQNVHFEDHMEDGRMVFDFRLRPGVVTRSNALALMRAVGLEV